jgi:hypothetical protein
VRDALAWERELMTRRTSPTGQGRKAAV